MALDYNSLIAYIDGLYSDMDLSPQEYNDIINYILAGGDIENAPRDLIQVRRGNKADLPTLAQGEMAFTLDTEELFIGGLGGNVSFKELNVTNVTNFGAKGDYDGTTGTDDTLAIQNAINHANSNGGGVVYFPAGVYMVTSDNENSPCLTIYPNVKIKGNKFPKSRIITSTPAKMVIGSETACDFVEFTDIHISANNLADHCIKLSDEYSAYLKFDNVYCRDSLDYGMSLSTFVSSFNKCFVVDSYGGYKMTKPTGDTTAGGTSCTFTSCYARNNEEDGFYLEYLNYSNLLNCASDGNKIAYKIGTAKSVNLIGCGSEESETVINAFYWKDSSIISFFASEVGGDTVPTTRLMLLTAPIRVNISGFHLSTSKLYTYKLGVTAGSYGDESVNILDDSIKFEDCQIVTAARGGINKSNVVKFSKTPNEMVERVLPESSSKKWYTLCNVAIGESGSVQGQITGIVEGKPMKFEFGISEDPSKCYVLKYNSNGSTLNDFEIRMYQKVDNSYVCYIKHPINTENFVVKYYENNCDVPLSEYATQDFSGLTLLWRDPDNSSVLSVSNNEIVLNYTGVTGERPLSPYVGMYYFDTTLGVPIWYDGTNWVDSTGAVV